ncbi:TonB-dependent receptor [Vibrio harveyi]|uniref:TonB-dependent receptor n=1 Tax=Vibrio harveyi TaxID=669 RepID=UPI003390D069
MYKNTTALSVAISLALGTAAVAPLAAQAEEQQVEQLQKMKVTGSRISTTDMEGPNPVDVYTADDIAKMGAVSVDDVLRGLTQNGAGSYGSSFTNSFAAGTSGVSLRGLGASRTLVLLNGRRVANYAFAQNLNDTFVDLNSIPLSAVERIDVLKDGASAIYGSDAIGGVVNVILKRDYEGFDVRLNGGQTSYSDGEDLDVTLTGGKTFNDATNIMASLNVVQKGNIMMKDRPNTKTADHSSQGGYDWRSSAGTPGRVYKEDGTWESLCTGGSAECNYNYNEEIAMIPESDRYNFLTSLNHQLDEDTNLFAELSLNRVESTTISAPTPDFQNVTISKDNPNNTYGEDVTMRHRILEAGNRINEITTDSIRVVAGAEGYANWFDTDVDWTADAGYHYTETENVGKNYLTIAGYQAAIDSGAYNPFVTNNPSSSLDGARVETKRKGESKLGFINAGASFPVFELSGGDAYVAVGGEFRYEAGSDTPDASVEANQIVGSGGTSSDGDRTVFAGYVELVAPVIEEVEVQLAGRAEHYSDFGSAFSPKVAVRYQPMDEVLFRASYSHGFKAPTLPEVNAGASTSYQTLYDPQTDTRGQYRVVSQGNKDLDAETAQSFNIGTVIEPLEDLSVKVDYFYIVNDDKIDTLGAQKLIDENSPNVVRKANGDIDYILDEYVNVAKQQVSGIDSEVKYDLSTDSYGDFLVKLAGTYNIEYKQSDSDGNLEDYIGTYFGGPRFKGKATLGYGYEDFAFTNIVNYTHSYDTRYETAEHSEVDALTTWDTQLAYTGIENATIAVGIRNVTDELAPFYNEAEGYHFAFHDNTGRFYYLQLEYGF